jgi:hypothetical protein
MWTNCSNGTARKTVEPAHAGNVLTPGPERIIECANRSAESRSLDWDQAVRAAVARLGEGWPETDTTGHSAAAGLAEELGALLCAYGLLAQEVHRGRDRADKLPALGHATSEHRPRSEWNRGDLTMTVESLAICLPPGPPPQMRTLDADDNQPNNERTTRDAAMSTANPGRNPASPVK